MFFKIGADFRGKQSELFRAIGLRGHWAILLVNEKSAKCKGKKKHKKKKKKTAHLWEVPVQMLLLLKPDLKKKSTALRNVNLIKRAKEKDQVQWILKLIQNTNKVENQSRIQNNYIYTRYFSNSKSK